MFNHTIICIYTSQWYSIPPMLFNEDNSNALYQITAYDDHSITVSGLHITQSVIVCATTLITDWQLESLHDINEEQLQTLYGLQPEILLIGTDQQPRNGLAHLRVQLEQHTIGVECMTRKAACRSYMALLSEERRVAALIFPGYLK